MNNNDELEIIEDITTIDSNVKQTPVQNTEVQKIETQQPVQTVVQTEVQNQNVQSQVQSTQTVPSTTEQIPVGDNLSVPSIPVNDNITGVPSINIVNPPAQNTINNTAGPNNNLNNYSVYNNSNNNYNAINPYQPESLEINEEVNPVTRSDAEDKVREKTKFKKRKMLDDKPSIFARPASEDEMLEQFIGKNYYKIRRNKFNFSAFFFGPLYFWYRKMFIAGYIYIIIISLITYILQFQFKIDNYIYEFAVTFIASLILGFSFNTFYVNRAKKKTEQIKKKYERKYDAFDIGRLCSRKGGGSVLYVILGFICLSFFSIIIALLVTIIVTFITVGTFTGFNFNIDKIKNTFNFDIDVKSIINKDTGKVEYTHEYQETVVTLYSDIKKRWSLDISKNTGEKEYARIDKEYCSSIYISNMYVPNIGLENDYYVFFDKYGNITKFYVSNGIYQYYYEGKGLNLKDINKGTNGNNIIESLSDENIIKHELICENETPSLK